MDGATQRDRTDHRKSPGHPAVCNHRDKLNVIYHTPTISSCIRGSTASCRVSRKSSLVGVALDWWPRPSPIQGCTTSEIYCHRITGTDTHTHTQFKLLLLAHICDVVYGSFVRNQWQIRTSAKYGINSTDDVHGMWLRKEQRIVIERWEANRGVTNLESIESPLY